MVLNLQHFENPEHTAQLQRDRANQVLDINAHVTRNDIIGGVFGDETGTVSFLVPRTDDNMAHIPYILFNAAAAIVYMHNNVMINLRNTRISSVHNLDINVSYLEGTITREDWVSKLVRRHTKVVKMDRLIALCTAVITGGSNILREAINKAAGLIARINREIIPNRGIRVYITNEHNATVDAGFQQALEIYTAAGAELSALFMSLNAKGELSKMVTNAGSYSMDSEWRLLSV